MEGERGILIIEYRWNRNLAYQRALHMGAEFKAKGVNIALGPVVGPIGRIAEGGRNWEGIFNDPYLCGALAFETVRGIQENGVVTSTKHFIGNEQGKPLVQIQSFQRLKGQNRIGIRAPITRASMLSRCRATSTTRRCTKFTFGPLLML